MDAFTSQLDPGPPRVLHLAGEIDIATADQLTAALARALSEGSPLVVDMAEVSFIDGRGLRAVVRAAQSMNGCGPLVLVNARLVARLLELTGHTDMPSLEIRGSE